MKQQTPIRILAYKPALDARTIGMEQVVCCEPLELEWLETYLADQDVTLLDGMIDDRNPADLARSIAAQVVLITSFITNIEHTLALAMRLKALPLSPLVFVGGPHAEVLPEHFDSPHIDGVFFANQLEAIAEVIDRIREDRLYQDVAGVAFRKGDQLVKNPSPPLDPTRLKIPRRRLLNSHPERYYYLHYRPCASIKTAFGCHESCTFCYCTEMHGGRYGPRPLEQVADELETIGVDNIYIVDDNFLASTRRLHEFCELVRARGITKSYIVYGDAAFIANNREALVELKAVGLCAVIVGFESIDDDTLADMNKRSRQADNRRTIEICNELGIELIPLFIVDPDWQPDDFKQLARYVRHNRLSFSMFSTRTVLPGTALARGREFGNNEPWWRYDLLRLHQDPRHMSRLRYYGWLLYLYFAANLGGESFRLVRRRLGLRGALDLSWRASKAGLLLLLKLLRWR